MMLRHTYLNTRLSLMAARLLPNDALERLLAGASLDMAGVHIHPPVSDADANAMEHPLFLRFLEEFTLLLRPLAGAERSFLLYWLRRHEILNFKALVRGRLAGLGSAEIQTGLVDLGVYAVLPVDAILRTDDVAEMLRALEQHGAYATEARYARQVYERKRELFILEATMDFRYYAELWQRARAVPISEQPALLGLVSRLLERINLVWLLRYRFNYGLSPAEAFYLLIPATTHSAAQLNLAALARVNTLDEFIAALPPALTRHLAGIGVGNAPITMVEQWLEEWVREHARRVLQHSHHALARALAYLILRECEINRIMAILKGKSLHLSDTIIRATLGVGSAMS